MRCVTCKTKWAQQQKMCASCLRAAGIERTRKDSTRCKACNKRWVKKGGKCGVCLKMEETIAKRAKLKALARAKEEEFVVTWRPHRNAASLIGDRASKGGNHPI